MDDLEQYQSRIFAALDKITRLSSETASASGASDEDEGLRQRDLELIDELEASLRDERADLNAERALAATLKTELKEAENALALATAQSTERMGAMSAAETELEVARARLAEVEGKLVASKSAHDEAKAALSEAESQINATARASSQDQKDQERQQNASALMAERIERLNARIESQDVQFQRLKDANAQLRESNTVLRERNAALLPDADVINKSMLVELEALKATRAADVDEMDSILEQLKPLVEGQISA